MSRFAILFATTILTSILFFACNNVPGNNPEKAKEEITNAEKAFNKMAAEKGVAEAFWFFADSNAVIKRGKDSIIHGKEGIRNFYSPDFYKTASVTWSPDFVDASTDGTMGYTYGKYLWQSKDSTGKVSEARGIFHTVWEKQTDGSWKYVWD
jgi:ketosteroid isomerase-like protein